MEVPPPSIIIIVTIDNITSKPFLVYKGSLQQLIVSYVNTTSLYDIRILAPGPPAAQAAGGTGLPRLACLICNAN